MKLSLSLFHPKDSLETNPLILTLRRVHCPYIWCVQSKLFVPQVLILQLPMMLVSSFVVGDDLYDFWPSPGPLANLLTKRFSHRSVVMLGATLVVTGIFSMPWFNSLHAMIVLYGFLAGNN